MSKKKFEPIDLRIEDEALAVYLWQFLCENKYGTALAAFGSALNGDYKRSFEAATAQNNLDGAACNLFAVLKGAMDDQGLDGRHYNPAPTAPDKIGCQDIQYNSDTIVVDGQIITLAEMKAMVKRVEEEGE